MKIRVIKSAIEKQFPFPGCQFYVDVPPGEKK